MATGDIEDSEPAKRPEQLIENLAADDLVLTPDELKQLDAASDLPPEYPGWMVPFQNSNRLEDVPRPGTVCTRPSSAM